MNFGDKVRSAREKLSLTQDEAAKKIRDSYNVRISGAYLSMIERNERTNLTIKLRNALIDFFQLDEFKIKPPKTKDLAKILEQDELWFRGVLITEEDKQYILKTLEFIYNRTKQINHSGNNPHSKKN